MDTTRIRLTNNVNADLFVADGTDFDPETLAMLQAFYSRSTKSIGDRTENLNSRQVKESLARYYVGYGHRSIGQCANFVIFLEDVSIFAAKAIQHHPLYNGQETSTRYYDFTSRPVVAPFEGEGWSDRYVELIRMLYSNVLLHATKAYLERAEQLSANKKLTDNEVRAAKAKAFDVARSILTAGFTTKLSWSTNFDQVQEQLSWLVNSPVPELNSIGLAVAEMLHNRYPQAIKDAVEFKSAYVTDCAAHSFFDDTDEMERQAYANAGNKCFIVSSPYGTDFMTTVPSVEPLHFTSADISLLTSRKRGQAVPRNFSRFGTYNLYFDIDYGSFRDLHRHRNGNVYFPTYGTKRVFHGWYAQELQALGVMDKIGIGQMSVAESLDYIYGYELPSIENEIAARCPRGSQAFKAAMMYYVPMGTLVKAAMRYDLPQAIYVAELRSARTVHPTARLVAHNLANAIRSSIPKSIPIFIDDYSGSDDSSRGKQTILELDTRKEIA